MDAFIFGALALLIGFLLACVDTFFWNALKSNNNAAYRSQRYQSGNYRSIYHPANPDFWDALNDSDHPEYELRQEQAIDLIMSEPGCDNPMDPFD